MTQLMSIPRELRDAIYRYSLLSDKDINPFPNEQQSPQHHGILSTRHKILYENSSYPFYATHLPCISLLAVSKTVHEEATELFYG